MTAQAAQPSWTFLTHHAHVLLCLAEDPQARLRDVAERVWIAERAVLRILRDLEEEGYISHRRVGRRSHYQINPDLPLRHPLQRHAQVRTLLSLVDGGNGPLADAH
ncbi:MAG: winged helix-turn-helix domain-containing protein [Chloroflexi bacterium]|nr:winged helix-turn-helix domain-containing protein [Chloroflexota bacterium]